jgi:protein-disulfide isomerase
MPFPMRRPLLAAALSVAAALPAFGCSAEPRAAAQTVKAETAKPETPAEAAFGEKVRAYLMQHPEVIQDAMNRLQELQTERLAAAAATAIQDNRAALERDVRDPVGGRADGKITVTEFFDYRCPYCKTAGPELAAFLARHKDVRFVYKEFPILSEVSEHAARLALAAKAQGKYEPVHLALMTAPQLSDAIIDDILKAHGVDLARAHKDADSPIIAAQLADVHKLAQTLAVSGTPAFIVGDRVSNGWVPEELDAYIALAEKAAPKTKTAALGE